MFLNADIPLLLHSINLPNAYINFVIFFCINSPNSLSDWLHSVIASSFNFASFLELLPTKNLEYGSYKKLWVIYKINPRHYTKNTIIISSNHVCFSIVGYNTNYGVAAEHQQRQTTSDCYSVRYLCGKTFVVGSCSHHSICPSCLIVFAFLKFLTLANVIFSGSKFPFFIS